jgi:hypothetical protein
MMHATCRLVLLAAALLAGACASRGAEQDSTPAQAEAELQGCRAPDESGCERCYEALPGDGGVVMSWSRAGVSDEELAASGTTPWFNALAVVDEPPAGVPACAQCLLREEQELRALGERPECDCTQPTGVDPCFTPGECGCYCERTLSLAKSCPSAAPRQK